MHPNRILGSDSAEKTSGTSPKPAKIYDSPIEHASDMSMILVFAFRPELCLLLPKFGPIRFAGCHCLSCRLSGRLSLTLSFCLNRLPEILG